MKLLRLGPVILVALIAAGCATTRSAEGPADEQFGHRFEGKTEDGRETIVIAPADENRAYQTGAALFDEVTIRPAGPAPDADEVPVEILVKGSFPDGCTELHHVTQLRTVQRIEVTLETRRPTGALCAAVMRPYRFYLELEGTYAPGSYTLMLNGSEHPFDVR